MHAREVAVAEVTHYLQLYNKLRRVANFSTAVMQIHWGLTVDSIIKVILQQTLDKN